MRQNELIAALRDMTGALPEDARLPASRELCTRFRVTPFTLQSALRELEREGRVVVLPRKGAFVRKGTDARRRFVEVVYLDDPRHVRTYERGLNSLARSAAGHALDCRTAHIDGADIKALSDLLARRANDSDCFGVVVAGYLSAQAGEVLETLSQPLVLFGDVFTLKLWSDLPIACGNGFQGALLAAGQLLERGCTHLVLVNFTSDSDWPWVREARAGVMAAVENRRNVRVLVPKTDGLDMKRVPAMRDEVQEWVGVDEVGRLGVLCREEYALFIASALCQALRDDKDEPALACMGVDLPARPISGMTRVDCSMNALAEATIQRLAAIRQGADTPGRQCTPYTIVPDDVSRAAPGKSAAEGTEGSRVVRR